MGADCLVDAPRLDAAAPRDDGAVLEDALRFPALLPLALALLLLLPVLLASVLRVPDAPRLPDPTERVPDDFCVVFFCPEATEVLVVFFF